jgi:hypothetical protein
MAFGALSFSAGFLSAATFGLRPYLLRGALGFLSFESGRSSMVVLGWVSGLALSIRFWILKFYLKIIFQQLMILITCGAKSIINLLE